MAYTQMLQIGAGVGEIQLCSLAYEEASYTSVLLHNLGAAGTSIPTGQTLQVSPREWPRVRGGKLSCLPTARQYTWLVTGSKATHQSAAVVAGESGKNAHGGQQFKQAVITQSNEYADPLLLRPTFAENRREDHQPGEGGNYFLPIMNLAGTNEFTCASTVKDLERPVNRGGRFKSSRATMAQSFHPSPKSRLAKHGAYQMPVGRSQGKDGIQVMCWSIEDRQSLGPKMVGIDQPVACYVESATHEIRMTVQSESSGWTPSYGTLECLRHLYGERINQLAGLSAKYGGAMLQSAAAIVKSSSCLSALPLFKACSRFSVDLKDMDLPMTYYPFVITNPHHLDRKALPTEPALSLIAIGELAAKFQRQR